MKCPSEWVTDVPLLLRIPLAKVRIEGNWGMLRMPWDEYPRSSWMISTSCRRLDLQTYFSLGVGLSVKTEAGPGRVRVRFCGSNKMFSRLGVIETWNAPSPCGHCCKIRINSLVGKTEAVTIILKEETTYRRRRVDCHRSSTKWDAEAETSEIWGHEAIGNLRRWWYIVTVENGGMEGVEGRRFRVFE